MTAPEPALHAWGSTLRIRVEVLVAGGRTLQGFLHLQPLASSHSGPETPEDMLNRSEGFIPLTGDDGHTVFLAKSQVVAVGVNEPPSISDPERLSAARSIPLRVELSDGGEFSGTATSELPPDRRRALDFLNHAPGFFALRSGDSVRYLNRAHLRVATPLD